MIPWLLIAELVVKKGQPLSTLVSQMIERYPVSGEINRTVNNPESIIADILAHYKDQAEEIDYTDGLSMNFENWRFNVRMSNTEPLLRLNVESRGDAALMQAKTEELLARIG
jgi:phosphomannomutase